MKIYDYNGKKNICGDRLREARVVRRLRQEDLAAQIQLKGINMERDSISRIEIGTRFVSDFELKIFAEVLGVSVNWLLGMKTKDLIELLERNGWKFKRHGANHDIYVKDGQRESVVRHRETDEELAKAIIKRRGLK